MALPSSGQISMLDIAYEMGIAPSGVSLRGMSQVAGKSSADAISEFYSYSQTDAQRYINAVNYAGTDLTSAEQTASIDLINGMVTDGIYNSVYGFYPMLGGNQDQQKINAKCVSGVRQHAQDLSLQGSWTYNTAVGITGNATDTRYFINFDYYYDSLDYSHFGVYQVSASAFGDNYGLDIGVYHQNYLNSYVGMTNNDQSSGDGGYGWDIPTTGLKPFFTSADPASMLMVRDTALNPDSLYFENETLYAQHSLPSYTLNDVTMVGGGYWDASGYTDRSYGFITFGKGLTSSEALDYQKRINDFQTALGRNVY